MSIVFVPCAWLYFAPLRKGSQNRESGSPHTLPLTEPVVFLKGNMDPIAIKVRDGMGRKEIGIS
ncbi:hypothetical protein [Mesorhizobium sp. M0047]|uniref:hypothetical protein n=1 Tax=Mesorhizobium sp. M0047 TaxID=2956859 RepID=UPI00333A2EDC